MPTSFLKTSFCFWSLFALACAALLWPGLVSGKVPAFRDAFHFYYPQAVWLDQCASQGEYFPQWQCNESLGVSVPGETTSALYYPLRVVWLLPGLSVAQRFSAFVLAHLLLAGLGMHYACSRMGLRKEAGWMAGATYALSCPFFFQHNNLVFLCSAAWLGFVLAELSCWFVRIETDVRRPQIVIVAIAVSMMVLAGDPHTAVNICILATFLLIVRGVTHGDLRWLGKSLVELAVIVLLAIGLSAVQSVPSLRWANHSHRWLDQGQARDARVKAVEKELAPESDVPSLLAEIQAQPAPRSSAAIYEFSLSPWHLLTAIWPTLGGRYSPENSRSFAYIPAEGRMWVPSVFFGVVPVLLLVSGFRRPRDEKYGWLLLAALFALLASFGNYSLGWMTRETLNALGALGLASQLPPDHSSGLYGLLVDWLPYYNMFRYPAKWCVIAVACATFAAATRMNQLGDADLLIKRPVHLIVISTSVIGVAVASFCGLFSNQIAAIQPKIHPDAWLGFPDELAVLVQCLTAFAIPLLVLCLLALARWRAGKVKLPAHALLAWISLLETFVVATNWCSFVAINPVEPGGIFKSRSAWSDTSEADIAGDRWLSDATSEVPAAIADYQRVFSLGKLGLLSNQRNLASILSIEPQGLRRLRSGLSKLDDLSVSQPKLDVVLAWLGVEQRLVRSRVSGARASFSWHSVPSPKQLCELSFDDPALSQTATVTWQWVATGQLDIQIDSPVNCRLVVRQFNDGGWELVSDREDSLRLTRDRSDLFIECALDAGKHKVTLKRSTRPQLLGVQISLAALLVAVGLSVNQLRIASATRSRSK